MLSRVLRTIKRHELLVGPGTDRVLCAVSGGPDSMALLACLWELGPRLGLTIEVATIDHGLRIEVAREISMVEERCAALALPFHRVRVDVAAERALSKSKTGAGRRGGVQEVARALRLEALSGLAAARGIGRVALGHHADDQTETVLFRILRGTGAAGLTGIPYRRDPFVRPLLDVTRVEILRYLVRRSIPYATDPSNADLRYARPRLRHQILPILRRENPRIDQALRSLAANVAEGRSGAQPSGRAEGRAEGRGVHIPTGVANEIAATARQGDGTRSYDIAGGRRVTVVYGQIRIEPRGRPDVAPGGEQAIGPTAIRGPGRYPVGTGGVVVVVREEVGPDQPGSRPDHTRWAWFDGDQLSWPLWVRLRRPGDRMRPRGGLGGRKLSDLLIDAKIPRPDRAALPVVTATGGDLLFVPGLRPSSTATPTETTRRRIGLAVASISDHDALVDRSINGGNTERDRSL